MTKCEYLFSSTLVDERIHILSEYKQGWDEKYEYEYEYENEQDGEDAKRERIFFIPIHDYENEKKATNIITEWLNNKCVKSKANVKGGKKTRRNKQRQKNKTQRRKSKKNTK
jgi:hypothetical protein